MLKEKSADRVKNRNLRRELKLIIRQQPGQTFHELLEDAILLAEEDSGSTRRQAAVQAAVRQVKIQVLNLIRV